MLRSLIVLACAAFVSSVMATQGHSWDYKALAAQPTPREWSAVAIWTFVTTSPSGKTEALTFRLTDQTAKTCTSGVWRKLVLIKGKLGSFAGVHSQAAYSVTGRFLWVSLNSNWGDADDDIRGELAGATFKGDHTAGGVFGGTFIGSVRGWRVQ